MLFLSSTHLNRKKGKESCSRIKKIFLPWLVSVWITLIFFLYGSKNGSPISNFLGFMHSTFLLHIFPDLHSWKFALYYANTTLKNMSQTFWTSKNLDNFGLARYSFPFRQKGKVCNFRNFIACTQHFLYM